MAELEREEEKQEEARKSQKKNEKWERDDRRAECQALRWGTSSPRFGTEVDRQRYVDLENSFLSNNVFLKVKVLVQTSLQWLKSKGHIDVMAATMMLPRVSLIITTS
jgi:hypothetical protein